MRRTKSPLLAAVLVALCGGWLASCDDDEKDLACAPEETRFCAGAGRCRGVQACLPDGSGFGDCDCSGPPREGTGGTSGEDPTPDAVGHACDADGDCGPGLRCLTSTSNEFLGGGPAGGYCTTECATDVDCTSIDRESQCVIPGEGATGLCLRTCLSQDAPLAENKCLGRYDLACNSVAYLQQEQFSGARQDGWCYPQCGSDDQCGSRRCDLARGLCVDGPVTGKAIGERCEQNADCAGRLCVGFSTGESFCSAPCVFGQPIGCGYGVSAPSRDAGCLFPQQRGFLTSEGVGDVGLCVELCSESSDCAQADRGWICDPSDDAVTVFGRPGICDAPAPADAGTDAGGDASTSAPLDAG